MKKIKFYINTMYVPAYWVLCIGLAIFSFTLCLLAINLRADMLAGESDMIYTYPKMMEEILFPLCILLPTTLAIDIKERSKKKS